MVLFYQTFIMSPFFITQSNYINIPLIQKNLDESNIHTFLHELNCSCFLDIFKINSANSIKNQTDLLNKCTISKKLMLCIQERRQKKKKKKTPVKWVKQKTSTNCKEIQVSASLNANHLFFNL